MKNYDWKTNNRDASADVEINDGVVTYYATIPDGVTFADIAREFAKSSDFGDEPHEEITFRITTLADGESKKFLAACTSENGIGGEVL